MARVAGTLSESLARAALDPATGVRLVDRREAETWLPWSEVLSTAERVAGGLQASGVEPGDRVGLIFGTGRELIEAYFGASLAGAIPASLAPPPRLGGLEGYVERVRAMLSAADAKLVLAEDRSKRRLGDAVDPTPMRTLAELPEGKRVDLPPVSPGDVAMIQFSSGTELKPKPAALSHRAILGQARLLNGYWPETGVTHRGCSWLPLYHDMGLIGCLLVALERPGELVLLPPEVFAARPAIWLRTISRYQATISPATNFAYAHCLDSIRDDELEGVDLSSWSVALNGAEPISADVMRRFAERFARWGFPAEALTPVYGLAEASLAVTFSEVDSPFSSRRFDRERLAEGCRVKEDSDGRELVSVGSPVPGFEVSIRDAEGGDLAEETVGRIWSRGPTLMEGYLGREDLTREVLRDGWLDTGDLGFLHGGEGDAQEARQLFICGRAKDVIIVRGSNHSAVELEQAAETVDGARVGGAAAVADLADGHERVVLFVERLRGSAPGSLTEPCREAVLARTGVDVDEVVELAPDSLPRTSSGKVRRAEVLRRHLAREGGR